MRVFRNEYFESLWVPLAGIGYPRAHGRVRLAPRAPGGVRVVGCQVGQVRLG